MYDFIFSVEPQAQNPYLPPLVGSFFGVLAAFLLNYAWQFLRDNHQKFVGEYHVKAELSGIKNDLGVGGKPEPIEPIYGPDYVREYHLFGEDCTQVIFWYKGFEKYNSRFEILERRRDSVGIQMMQHSEANLLGGILSSQFLKRIPDSLSNSGLSRTKFVWYLLGQDALEEPTRKGQFRNAIVDKLLKK